MILTMKVVNKRVSELQKNSFSMFSEHAMMNFERFQSNLENQLFNAYTMYDIPSIMYNLLKDENPTTRHSLQYAVKRTVSAILPFDYVLAETIEGHVFYASWAGDSFNTEHVLDLLDCTELKTSNTKAVWLKDENDDVFLIRYVYNVSPLKYVGKIIAKISDDRLFRLSDSGIGMYYSICFFDIDNEHIITAGVLNKELKTKIINTVEEFGFSEAVKMINGKDFYAILQKRGKWTGIGILSMEGINIILDSMLLVFCFIGGFMLLLGLCLMVLISMPMTKQLTALTVTMNNITEKGMRQYSPVYSEDDIGKLAQHFNRMTDETFELMERLVNEEKLKNETQMLLLAYRYRSLQSQINPHFIYNAFETVNAMAKISGNNEIASVINLICKYFHHITLNIGKQFVSIIQEFESLHDYTTIYVYIYGSRLVTRFSCSKEVENELIPTMVLQPIIENALTHGIRSESEDTVISIAAEKIGDWIKISVEDNGPGIASDTLKNIYESKNPLFEFDEQSGIALPNVIERLRILYADDAKLDINSSENGTEISIFIRFGCLPQIMDNKG
jgi:two-component system sensor histidine kinase YesM